MHDLNDLNYCITIELDLKDYEHVKFMNSINTFYNSCVNIIYANRALMKLHRFNTSLPVECGFDHPIKYHRNEFDGLPLPNKNPYMCIQLANTFPENIIHNGHHFNAKNFVPDITFIPIINFNLIVRRNRYCLLKYEMIGAEIL